MTTLREAAEAVIEQLKGTWVSESDPAAQDLKAALAEPVPIIESEITADKEQPQRKPLTNDAIVAMWHPTVLALSALEFARAIERAHGIGGNE